MLQDLPLTYRFGYVSNTTGQEQLLASQGQASPFTEGVILPVGTFAVVVYVRDAFLSEFRGSVASDRLSAVLVTCVPFVANATALQGTVNSALDSVLLSGDSAGAVAQVAVFASVREVTLSWSLAFSFSPDLSYFFLSTVATLRVQVLSAPTVAACSVDCGAFGSCFAGACVCNASSGYTGETCGVAPVPVDGQLTAFVNTSCSSSCGGGEYTAVRTCIPPRFGGAPCDGPLALVVPCNEQPCVGDAVDGGYSEWSDWGQCDADCPTGTVASSGERRKARACNNPLPSKTGRPCSDIGPAVETGELARVPCCGASQPGCE